MKIKTKLKACFVCVLSLATGIYAGISAQSEVSAAEQNINFSVRVAESLSVTLTTDNLSATSSAGNFMTNNFSISVATNTKGYTATMYSATSNPNPAESYTSLRNTITGDLIPTLAANASGANNGRDFPKNRWGYSTDGATGEFKAMSTSPIVIASDKDAYSGSKTVHFGAKIDVDKAQGTYANNVIVNVTGTYSGNPSKPADGTVNTPSQDTDQDDHYATHVSGTNTSVYVPGDDKKTTQIISGNYTAPLGVSESTYYTTSNTTGDSSLATGLVVASVTAAVSGGFFFLLAKLRDRDDEEEL